MFRFVISYIRMGLEIFRQHLVENPVLSSYELYVCLCVNYIASECPKFSLMVNVPNKSYKYQPSQLQLGSILKFAFHSKWSHSVTKQHKAISALLHTNSNLLWIWKNVSGSIYCVSHSIVFCRCVHCRCETDKLAMIRKFSTSGHGFPFIFLFILMVTEKMDNMRIVPEMRKKNTQSENLLFGLRQITAGLSK